MWVMTSVETLGYSRRSLQDAHGDRSENLVALGKETPGPRLCCAGSCLAYSRHLARRNEPVKLGMSCPGRRDAALYVRRDA
jgi:hypothetical protein